MSILAPPRKADNVAKSGNAKVKDFVRPMETIALKTGGGRFVVAIEDDETGNLQQANLYLDVDLNNDIFIPGRGWFRKVLLTLSEFAKEAGSSDAAARLTALADEVYPPEGE